MEKTTKTEKKGGRTLADTIRYEGIKAKGFGTIPKFIMHDRDLTLESKAIYGYFAALCGNGVETFPSVTNILRALKLSKDGYYNHYHALKEQGYITVSKLDPTDIKSPNVYTIVANPPKVDIYVGLNSIRKEKELVREGIDCLGYGILPKAVMMDDRLDIKAKGIYCYFASYAGAGDTAFPRKEHILYHLKIAHNTYYRYLNQLIQYNYIVPIQRKENGRFGVCDYKLNNMPDETIGTAIQQIRKNRAQSPRTQKQELVKPMVESAKNAEISVPPCTTNQELANQELTNQELTKQETTNISGSSNRLSNNRRINQSIRDAVAAAASPPIDSIDTAPMVKIFSKEEVADKVGLAGLSEQYKNDHKYIDMMHNIICEVLTADNNAATLTVQIDKKKMSIAEAKKEFLKLEKKHLEYVLDSINKDGTKDGIKHPKPYLATSLYHAPRTIGYYFDKNYKDQESEQQKTGKKKKQAPKGFNGDHFFDKIERNSRKLLE